MENNLEVRLINGAHVSKRNMNRIMKKLHKLHDEKGQGGRDALDELFRYVISTNPDTMPTPEAAMLKNMRLLEKDGTVLQLVRDVVVSASYWIDDQIVLRSPLPHAAKPTAHSHRPAIEYFIEQQPVSAH